MTAATTGLLSGPAAAEAAGVTYRMLDYWCRNGALGDQHAQGPSYGGRRQLTVEDVTVLRTLGRLSDALNVLTSPARTREVAAQVRAGATVVRVRLSPAVELTVTVDTPASVSAAGVGEGT